jgi:predicted PurR-regulated permease PerM
MEQSSPSQPIAWPPRKVALATVLVVVIICAFWLLFRFRLVFISLFTAIVLSTALKPVVNRLARWHISPTVSVLIISTILILVILLLLSTVVPRLADQWATLTGVVDKWYIALRQSLIESASLLVRRIALQLPRSLPFTIPTADIDKAVEANPMSLVEQALNIGAVILRSLLLMGGIWLLTNFWIIEGERSKRFLLLAVPIEKRENVRSFWEDIEGKVGAYTRGLIILCSIIGGMALAAYLIIGLPNVLLLALFAGLMEAVPLVGPALGAIPAIMVAASTDPSKVVWVIVATIIFQTLENNLIAPRVMDRAVGIIPVASLLAFIAFSSIFGFVGALLAIPLAAVIQLTLQYFLFKPNPIEQEPPVRRDAISALRYEAQDLVIDVRKQIRTKDGELNSKTDQFEDALEAVVQDLDSILAQVETRRQENGSPSVVKKS